MNPNAFNFNKPATTQASTGLNLGQTSTFGQQTSQLNFGGQSTGSAFNKPTTGTIGTGLGGGAAQQGGLSFSTGNIQGGGGLSGMGTSTGGQSTGFNFQGMNTQSSNIFNKPATTSTSSTFSFAPKTDSNLLQQPGLNFPSSNTGVGGFSNYPNTQSNVMGQTQPNKKENDRWEIINVIQSYINALSPATNQNVFKSMLYNRVPKGYEGSIQSFQHYPQKIKGEDGSDIFVDYNQWVKALQNNPSPNIHYPYQVSSPCGLVQRMKTTEVLELSGLETILNLQNNLNDLNNLYDNEIEGEVSGIKKKLKYIKDKQLHIICKMDRLALLSGIAERNYSLENSINSRLNNIKSVMTDTNEYTNKIKELSSMTNLIGEELSSTDDQDYLKDFNNNRFEKSVNILRDMKKIIDVTFKNLKDNISVVNFIKNDLENLQKYGKIPK